MLSSLIKIVRVKPEKHFVREVGNIFYVADGLMKECDLQARSEASIINFLGNGQCSFCFTNTQRLFVAAILPSTLFSLDLMELYELHQAYTELAHIYRFLRFEYHERLLLRIQLLEMVPRKRIIQFCDSHRLLLPYLKKKDMANYLHLDYDYFVRTYRKLQ